jgi:hypothetical protein
VALVYPTSIPVKPPSALHNIIDATSSVALEHLLDLLVGNFHLKISRVAIVVLLLVVGIANSQPGRTRWRFLSSELNYTTYWTQPPSVTGKAVYLPMHGSVMACHVPSRILIREWISKDDSGRSSTRSSA